MAEKPSSGGQITLDQLVASASQSVLRALEEHQRQGQVPGGVKINPRIWVGIWIDPVNGGFEVPGQVTGGSVR
ncbi:MAG TPA: hypothetical protein VGP73_04325 [Thermoanaerobaculia bacterium]